MAEQLLFEYKQYRKIPPKSEAMKITNMGDSPVDGYILNSGFVKRDGKVLDFFVVKFYFNQINT